MLEEKYQWVRQLGVIYDFPNIATSQQSYNKEWQKWPDKGELKDRLVGQIPLGRLGLPEDCAKVIEFLVTDLSDYVTGQTINVCGGYVKC